jgi:hypothetical protein
MATVVSLEYQRLASAVDPTSGCRVLRKEADHVGVEEPHTGRLARRDHRVGVGDGPGERFLADHVSRGSGGRDRDIRVLMRGGADVDEIALPEKLV